LSGTGRKWRIGAMEERTLGTLVTMV